MIQILILLEIKDESTFKEFEYKAIRIMKKYGGKLLTAFKPDSGESSDKIVGEIHLLEFPTLEMFKNYRADEDYLKLKELRERAIARTTLYVSGKEIIYD